MLSIIVSIEMSPEGITPHLVEQALEAALRSLSKSLKTHCSTWNSCLRSFRLTQARRQWRLPAFRAHGSIAPDCCSFASSAFRSNSKYGTFLPGCRLPIVHVSMSDAAGGNAGSCMHDQGSCRGTTCLPAWKDVQCTYVHAFIIVDSSRARSMRRDDSLARLDRIRASRAMHGTPAAEVRLNRAWLSLIL